MPVNAITVTGLDVALSGVPILKDISFSIDEAQTVALLGDNGSGKTTLIRAILGLVAYQGGSIDLLGTPLTEFSAWDQIGYVPQRASVSLHSTTVSEVVGSGVLAKRPIGWMRRADRQAIKSALEHVGMEGHANELYLHLSGGQQQRVLIARGIVNQPKLIIMDEPFAGVDLANQSEIADVLHQVGATIFVVLHETEALMDSLSRTIILREGRLVYDGPPTTLDSRDHHEVQPPQRTSLLSGMEPRWNS